MQETVHHRFMHTRLPSI